MRAGAASLASVVLTLGCASPAGDAPAQLETGDTPLRLVYAQDFETPAALADFELSDPAAWRWSPGTGGGSLELLGESAYEPPYRSPTSLAILKDVELGDFLLEAELMQTGREYGHRDMCLFFGYRGPTRYYYAHLAPAPDENAHNVFIVNDAPRARLGQIPDAGVRWKDDTWHRVELERRGANVEVRFDGGRVLSVRDSAFPTGRVGFGSFDDSGRIRRVRLWAP